MRTRKPDVDNPEVILDSNDDPVFISFDVEDNPVVRRKTRVAVDIFDIRRTFPPGMFNSEAHVDFKKRNLVISLLQGPNSTEWPLEHLAVALWIMLFILPSSI